jgi:hypothetical protein
LTVVSLTWSQHLFFGAIDKIAGFFGSTEPGHWLTIGSNSDPVKPLEVGGKTYILDLELPQDWRRPGASKGWRWGGDPAKGPLGRMRVHGRGTLTSGGTDTEVTLNEVTDTAVKHRVLIAYAARDGKSSANVAFGDLEHLKGKSSLVVFGVAPDDTPEGLAAAVPYVAVFEVTPA